MAASMRFAWKALTASGHPPSRLQGFTATPDAAASLAYVFGGRSARGLSDELHVIDLATDSTAHWAPVRGVPGEPPAAREGHAAALTGDGALVIYGGDLGRGEAKEEHGVYYILTRDPGQSSGGRAAPRTTPGGYPLEEEEEEEGGGEGPYHGDSANGGIGAMGRSGRLRASVTFGDEVGVNATRRTRGGASGRTPDLDDDGGDGGDFQHQQQQQQDRADGNTRNTLAPLRGPPRWERRVTVGTLPAPRVWHSVCTTTDAATGARMLYVFGGRNVGSGPHDELPDDLYVLNIDRNVWQRHTAASVASGGGVAKRAGRAAAPVWPSGRQRATLTETRSGKLILSGGFDREGNALRDMYMLDGPRLTWRLITAATSLVPSARGAHSAVSLRSTTRLPGASTSRFLVMFGGSSTLAGLRSGVACADSCLAFHFAQREWVTPHVTGFRDDDYDDFWTRLMMMFFFFFFFFFLFFFFFFFFGFRGKKN
jgi:hypothetical protein